MTTPWFHFIYPHTPVISFPYLQGIWLPSVKNTCRGEPLLVKIYLRFLYSTFPPIIRVAWKYFIKISHIVDNIVDAQITFILCKSESHTIHCFCEHSCRHYHLWQTSDIPDLSGCTSWQQWEGRRLKYKTLASLQMQPVLLCIKD